MNERYVKLNMMQTGMNLRKIMKERGYTVREIQKYLKLGTTQSIYHWFEGRNMPSVDNLYALSELFHVPVDTILRGNRTDQYTFFGDLRGERLFCYYEKCFRKASL